MPPVAEIDKRGRGLDNPTAKSRNLAKAYALIALAYIAALVVAMGVGYAMGERHPILVAFAADVAATLAIYAFARCFHNASFYDPYWSVAPIAIAIFWVATAASTVSFCRTWIVITLVTLWSLRLTWNWARGWRGLKHEDWRYADMRTRHGIKKRFWIVELIGIELVPTLVVFLGCLSLYPVLADSTKAIWWLSTIAALVAAAAIFIEATSDEQMISFAKTKQPGQIMNRGLWKYSRHPNYFGEVTFWWGLYFFGLAANPSYWWTIVGPIAITMLFIFISIPMMDKRSLERRAGYEERMKKVSALVPWKTKE
jgi:steroid 5-alpha reductase family enzyme